MYVCTYTCMYLCTEYENSWGCGYEYLYACFFVTIYM